MDAAIANPSTCGYANCSCTRRAHRIAVGTAACFAARGRPSRGTAAEEKGGGLSTRFFTVLVSVIGFVGPLRLLLLEVSVNCCTVLYGSLWFFIVFYLIHLMLISSPCLNDDNMASYYQHDLLSHFVYLDTRASFYIAYFVPSWHPERKRETDRYLYIYIYIYFKEDRLTGLSQTGIEKSMVASLISTTI